MQHCLLSIQTSSYASKHKHEQKKYKKQQKQATKDLFLGLQCIPRTSYSLLAFL
jgi:hypothetical protein